MTTLRIVNVQVVDSSNVNVTFTSPLTPNLIPANVSFISQTPGAPDAQALRLSVSGAILAINSQPLTPLASYFLQFQSVPQFPFQSVNGDAVISNDGVSNKFLITAPLSPENPVANYLGSFYNGSIYDAMQDPNSVVSQYINSLAVNLSRVLYDIGQLKNENYLELDIVDEQKIRGGGPFDRLNQEGAYLVSRVGKGPTKANLPAVITFTDFPSYPVTLQGQIVTENLTPNSLDKPGFFNINNLDLNVLHSPVTRLTSVIFTLSTVNPVYTYDISKFGYQIQNSRYDQDFGFSYQSLASNQFRLSNDILSDPLFSLDNIISIQVQYQYKNEGTIIDPTTVTVTTSLQSVREVLPPIVNVFFLQHAPILDGSGKTAIFGGVTFTDPNQAIPGALHPAFLQEITFRLSALPSVPGTYAIDYSVGQVYVYGNNLNNDGTGPSPPLATYTYLLTYQPEIDYVFDDTSSDLVSLPPGNLVNNAGTINFEYEQVFIPGIDYTADIHIESLEERIGNNLVALNVLTTQKAPITNVFQIFNETSGEIYTLTRWYDNRVYFQFTNPPNIVSLIGERATFNLITNELLFVHSTLTNSSNLSIFQIFLNNNTLVAGTEDTTASSFNTSLAFSDGNVFVTERWFSPDFSVAFNISRLLHVGEYMVDYINGIIYVAVANTQNQSIGTVIYRNDQIDPQFPHVLSVTDIYYRISPLLPKNAEFAYTSFADGSIIPAVLNPSAELYLNANTGAPYQLFNGSVGVFSTGGFIPGVTYQVKFVRSVFEYADLLSSTNPINFALSSTSSGFNINVGPLVKMSNERVQFDGSNYFILLNENIPYLSPHIQFTFSIIRNSDNAQLWNSSGTIVPGNPLKLVLPGINSPQNGDNVTVNYSFTIQNISRIVVDYNKGDFFVDYTYLADEILVSYEYGDNYLDFRNSLALNTNDIYYVTYKAGALRDALLKNFGTLVNIPELSNVDLTFDRQRYREALQAALSSFVQGPTIPAIKNIGKIISHIEPELIESAFQSWTLGQGLLNPQPITTTGAFQLLPAKFGDGALINDPDQTIKFPVHSNLRLEEGTFETWIIPQWNGLDNNSTLTFNIIRDGYAINPGFVFIGASEYHPTITNGTFSVNKFTEVIGTPNTNKDGIFIYYDKDISGSFFRWYVRVIDGYVEPSHFHSAYKIVIKTTGTIYDNKSLVLPKPLKMTFFTGTSNITLNIAGGPPPPTPPAPPPIINLGAASTFGVLAASTVTNTGFTTIGGDVGLNPGSSVTGFPPGTFTGTLHVDDATAISAQLALTAAYTAGNLLIPTTTFPPIHDIGGTTLSPGVYMEPSSLGITGTVTLDAGGNSNAFWVFQIGSTLTTAAGNSVVALVNGASAANVFWLVGSSATLGTNTTFVGSILALASVTATTGANITGRLLAQTAAVTLNDNHIVVPSSSPSPPGPSDGYGGINEGITFLSDPDQYILDFGKSTTQSRLSIYKDASGYLNFRTIGHDKKIYAVSADISAWQANQQHFIAASWKLNTFNNRDEMHLFIDGFEVPNIIRYGQKLQPYLHEKFRTINPEEIVGLVNRDIVGSHDLTTTAGSNVVTSSLNFSSFNIFIGDTIFIDEVGFAPAGYTIGSINGQTLVLNTSMPVTLPGDGKFSVNRTAFNVVTDINITPNIEVTTIHAMIKGTDIIGTSGFNTITSAITNFTAAGIQPGFLIRIDNNSLRIVYTILQVSGHTLVIDDTLLTNVSPTVFQVYSNTENELPGVRALFPAYSISRDVNFNNILTISNDTQAGDLILVRTLGINYRDVVQQYYVWSSGVENILMTRLPPPISLDQAQITKIIMPAVAVGPANSTLFGGIFTSINFSSTDTPTGPLNLGAASTFAVLGASTVTNTGASVVHGDLGLSPGTSVTGFPPGIVTGTIHDTDAAAASAQLAVTAAFVVGNALPGGVTLSGDIGGQTLTPGIYKSASTLGITGTLTLNAQGNPNASWIFQIGSALTTAAGNSSVVFINGGLATNVFWLIGSSATLGTNTTFAGNILAQASITATTGANITGRLLAQVGAVTLDTNIVSIPPPGTIIPHSVYQPTNGQTGRTISVTIAGNNVDFSTPVQVTINGQSNSIPTTETLSFTNYGTEDFINPYNVVNFIKVVVKPINPLKSALTVTAFEKYSITHQEFDGYFPVVKFSYHMGGGYTLFSNSPNSVRDNNNTFSGLDIGNYLVIKSPAAVAGFYIITGLSPDLKTAFIQATSASFSLPLSPFTNGIYEVLNVNQYRSGLQNGFFTFEQSTMPGQPYFLNQGFYKLEYATYISIKFDPTNEYCYLGSDLNGNNQINAILNQIKIYSTMLTDTRVGEIIPTNQHSITKDFNSLKTLKSDSTTLMLITLNSFPFVNSAPVYVTLPSNFPLFQSNFVVNDNFGQSVVFLDQPIIVPNEGILDTRKEGTIEFWVSPLLDTNNDPHNRTYFDAYGAVLETAVSTSDVTVKISAPASQILSVRLQTGDPGIDYFAGGKLEIDTQRAIQEETVSLNANTVIVAQPLLQVLTVKIANDPTGVDYFAGGSIGSDRETIYLGIALPQTNLPLVVTYQSVANSNTTLNTQVIRLNRRLPNQNTPVVVNYIPKGLQGDHLQLFKDQSGYINFTITASGTDFVIRAPTFWVRNTWHRIKASYKINGGLGQDEMRLFLDGYEWSDLRFGSGAVFGPAPFFMGAAMPGDGYADGYSNDILTNIIFKDPINDLFIGTDYTRNDPIFSLIDNLRISNQSRPIYAPYGEPLDVNYTSNLNVAFPVTRDLYTTYLLDFNSMTTLNSNFATIKNRETGNYDFSINIIDSFGIVASSIDVKNTLNTLINILKPANSRAFINYI
jgi:hypothetical protein